MKTPFRIAVLLIVAALPPHRAAGADLAACCACVDTGSPFATTSQLPPPRPALFCAQVPPADGLTERCVALGADNKLLCIADMPGPSCSQQLAETGIICPQVGAPAAGGPALVGLALAMSVLGAWAVRRRSSR